MKWGVQVLNMGPVTCHLKYIIVISFSLIPHKDIHGLLCTGEVMYEIQCKVQHSEVLYEVNIKIGGVGTIQSVKTHHHTICMIGILSITPYLLTPWCRVLLEKLTGLQLVKKFPAFHGTRRFITTLTSVHHLSLSWASPIKSIYPHPTSWRSILILSTHLCLGLPSGVPSGFPTKTLYTPLSSTIRATCPAHLNI